MNEWFEKFNDDEAQMTFGEDMRKYEMYVLIPYLIPILFFLPIAIDKESEFCKFHANQSFCWFIVMGILEIAAGVLGALGPATNLLAVLLNLLGIAAEIFLIAGAYKGYAIRIPLLGDKINIFK